MWEVVTKQTCIAKVTCLVWRRAVPLSGGCFSASRLLTDSRRTCVALLHSMRKLGYWKLCCACVDLGGEVDLVSARGSHPRLGWQLAADHGGLPCLAVASPAWDNFF